MSPPLPGQLELPLPGLVDIAAGERLREDGIARAQGGAPALALWEAVALVRRLAETRAALTTDDVWLRLEALREEGAMGFPEPRAMGAVMRLAEKAEWIAPTERHALSTRKACHRRPLRVWRSLLYRGRAA